MFSFPQGDLHFLLLLPLPSMEVSKTEFNRGPGPRSPSYLCPSRAWTSTRFADIGLAQTNSNSQAKTRTDQSPAKTGLRQTFFLTSSPNHPSKNHTATRQPCLRNSGAPISYQIVSVSRNFTAARISCILFRCVGLSSAVLHSVVCGIKAV